MAFFNNVARGITRLIHRLVEGEGRGLEELRQPLLPVTGGMAGRSATPDLQEGYLAALHRHREAKDAHFRHDPYSPIPHEERDGWAGLRYFDPDPALHLTLPLRRDAPQPLTFQTSSGQQDSYTRIGTVAFEVAGQPAYLALYESSDGDLFLPFRDATSGAESYGAGRYLEPTLLGGDEVMVDFNLAYNPYCAYSPDFSCPLPPVENWLKVPIRAGERSYRDEQ